MAKSPVTTLVIDNFRGRLTEYVNGDINSGWANVFESFCYDAFSFPGVLTWNETPVQIDPTNSIITGLILAGKERVENGILYVYGIDSNARLYKIQVNDPTTFNPSYNNPVLIATLTINSPTFTRGGFIDFYGATSKIYIGHDKGVTSINFDGTGEAFVGVLGSWTQTVPRPLQQFLGSLYVGNGSNIAQIDSTLTVVSYAKLSPGFPSDTQVRDLDVTPEGNYLQIVSSSLELPDITSAAQNTSYVASTGSFIFKWNGTDTGYTSFNTFPTFDLSANIMFQDSNYTFGSDARGGAVFNPTQKIITDAYNEAPLPTGVSSSGNVVSYNINFYNGTTLEFNLMYFGSLDWEVGTGYWCPMGFTATGTETDVIRAPLQLQVSNKGQGASNNGYVNNIFGVSQLYFSTLETSATTTKYKLYSWAAVPTGEGDALVDGVYQTQTQLFSKKVQIKEVRVYGQPWVADNSFTIDLIGSAGTPIPGASKTFTAGSNLTIGDDFAWYTPQSAPTYAIGLRVTNNGIANHFINKIEIDYAQGGQ